MAMRNAGIRGCQARGLLEGDYCGLKVLEPAVHEPGPLPQERVSPLLRGCGNEWKRGLLLAFGQRSAGEIVEHVDASRSAADGSERSGESHSPAGASPWLPIS